MVPTRMPVMPAGASEPCAESPSRRLYDAWTYFKVGVLYVFYKRFHRTWTTAFEDITSAEPYYFRMPRLGNLVDQYLFHNALDVNEDSVQTARLRLNAQTQKKMDRLVGEIGIDVIDELGCCSGTSIHADALRKTYGRSLRYNLDAPQYMKPEETWGCMPVNLWCGDFYQLPTVPASSSLNLAYLVDKKMEESGDDDEEMEEQWDW